MSEQKTKGLEGLSPSAKLVYKVLEYEAPLTQAEIIQESQLSQRTVYNALQDLEEYDLVDSKPRTEDLRQRVYWVP